MHGPISRKMAMAGKPQPAHAGRRAQMITRARTTQRTTPSSGASTITAAGRCGPRRNLPSLRDIDRPPKSIRPSRSTCSCLAVPVRTAGTPPFPDVATIARACGTTRSGRRRRNHDPSRVLEAIQKMSVRMTAQIPSPRIGASTITAAGRPSTRPSGRFCCRSSGKVPGGTRMISSFPEQSRRQDGAGSEGGVDVAPS